MPRRGFLGSQAWLYKVGIIVFDWHYPTKSLYRGPETEAIVAGNNANIC